MTNTNNSFQMSADVRCLLELAAKAAGIEHQFNEQWNGFYIRLKSDTGIEEWDRSSYWNPLTVDGDALRLLVKLGIALHLRGDEVSAYRARQAIAPCMESFKNDPMNATRYAITRVAAEIGKQMG